MQQKFALDFTNYTKILTNVKYKNLRNLLIYPAVHSNIFMVNAIILPTPEEGDIKKCTALESLFVHTSLCPHLKYKLGTWRLRLYFTKIFSTKHFYLRKTEGNRTVTEIHLK